MNVKTTPGYEVFGAQELDRLHLGDFDLVTIDVFAGDQYADWHRVAIHEDADVEEVIELYDGATEDAQALNKLAAKLDKGQANAARIVRKSAQFIEAGDGKQLDLRVDELQRLTVSNPETAEVINGLAMMQRHERKRLPIPLCCRELQAEWAQAGGVA
jgi:hypothetical protein